MQQMIFTLRVANAGIFLQINVTTDEIEFFGYTMLAGKIKYCKSRFDSHSDFKLFSYFKPKWFNNVFYCI